MYKSTCFKPLPFGWSPNYDILQAIQSSIHALPVSTIIAHVKGHQDNKKSWDELDMHAQITVLADGKADEIYSESPVQTGLFLTWVLGTGAALFHNNDAQVIKGIPEYIWDAKHTLEMKQCLIQRSHTVTGHDKSWSKETYSSIDWNHYGETFKKLSIGQQTQLSKYANNLLSMVRWLHKFDNNKDGRCFACHQLWEDMTHGLTCACEARCTARTAA
jgi:hypothetical protein